MVFFLSRNQDLYTVSDSAEFLMNTNISNERLLAGESVQRDDACNYSVYLRAVDRESGRQGDCCTFSVTSSLLWFFSLPFTGDARPALICWQMFTTLRGHVGAETLKVRGPKEPIRNGCFLTVINNSVVNIISFKERG